MNRMKIDRTLVLLLALGGWVWGNVAKADDDTSDESYFVDKTPPPGTRQFKSGGKLWPPYPRPTGKHPTWKQHYHYAHYWPLPQVCDDRSSVRAAMDQQVYNGWLTETTLYGQHFDPTTDQLNSAGKIQLRWILLHTPAAFRSVYVQMGETAQQDQLRLASVQEIAGAIVRDGTLPPIALRNVSAYGTNAQEVDMLRRKYVATQPTPRLPVLGGGAGASSGGTTSSSR